MRREEREREREREDDQNDDGMRKALHGKGRPWIGVSISDTTHQIQTARHTQTNKQNRTYLKSSLRTSNPADGDVRVKNRSKP